MLALHKTATSIVVQVEGSGSFPLPLVDVLKSQAIEFAIAYSGEDSDAVRILRDCELDYEIVPGKDAFEELIGVVITVSVDDAAILNAPRNPVLPEVMGALLEACPDLGSERIVSRGGSS